MAMVESSKNIKLGKKCKSNLYYICITAKLHDDTISCYIESIKNKYKPL